MSRFIAPFFLTLCVSFAAAADVVAPASAPVAEGVAACPTTTVDACPKTVACPKAATCSVKADTAACARAADDKPKADAVGACPRVKPDAADGAGCGAGTTKTGCVKAPADKG